MYSVKRTVKNNCPPCIAVIQLNLKTPADSHKNLVAYPVSMSTAVLSCRNVINIKNTFYIKREIDSIFKNTDTAFTTFSAGEFNN